MMLSNCHLRSYVDHLSSTSTTCDPSADGASSRLGHLPGPSARATPFALVEIETIASSEIDLESFLCSWYGRPDRPSISLGLDFDWVPEALRGWYELSSRWSVALTANKRFLPVTAFKQEDDKYIFLGDQGDWAWAFDPADPTVVYVAEGDDPWQVVPESFTEFLLHNAISEAVETGAVTQWSNDITDTPLRAALSPFSIIEFREWSWPSAGGQLYMNSEAIALVQKKYRYREPWDTVEGHYELTIGAKSQQSIAYLDSIDGVEWRRR
jgi:hypothetical protein